MKRRLFLRLAIPAMALGNCRRSKAEIPEERSPRWLALDGSGGCWKAFDFQRWKRVVLPEGVQALAVTWVNKRFLVAGAHGGRGTVLASPDCATWREVATPEETVTALAPGQGGHCLAASGQQLLVSASSEDFEAGVLLGATLGGAKTLQVSHIVSGDTEAGYFYAMAGTVRDSERGWSATTGDGLRLDHLELTSTPLLGLAYGAGHFVRLRAELIESSHDGQTWSRHECPGDLLREICWSGRRFLSAAPASGVLWGSAEALTWERTEGRGTKRILWADEKADPPLFFGTSPLGELAFSHDLREWQAMENPLPPIRQIIARGD